MNATDLVLGILDVRLWRYARKHWTWGRHLTHEEVRWIGGMVWVRAKPGERRTRFLGLMRCRNALDALVRKVVVL